MIIRRRTKIYGMASERSHVLEKLKKLSSTLESHIVKIGVYNDDLSCKDPWIDEIANFLSIANDFKIKPRGKKLRRQEYETFLIGGLGDTRMDASANARMFQIENRKSKQYPDFQVTDELVDRVFFR